jgi:hypothetical protein
MVRNASAQAEKCGSKSTTRFERERTISSAILRPVRFCSITQIPVDRHHHIETGVGQGKQFPVFFP